MAKNIQAAERIKNSNCKRIFIFILFLALVVPQSKMFAVEHKIEDTEYSMELPAWAWNFSMKFNKWYPVIEYEFSLDDYDRQDFALTVRNNNNELSYDLSKLLYEDYITWDYDNVSFFKQDNGISMLYLRSDYKCFVITFDFSKKTVTAKILGFLSSVLRDMAFTPEEVSDYFMLHKMPSRDLTFNYDFNTFCDFTGNYDFQTRVTVNDTVSMECYSEDNLHLHEVPNTISLGSKYIANKLVQEKVIYSTDTYLTEGSLKYTPDNMKGFSDVPWCPAEAYQDETIYIKTQEPIEGLYFGNGYYRSDKKYLYGNNCRVKELEITFLGSSLTQKVTLEDSGFLQFIPLIDVNETNLKIKILSVYEGDKYSDLCINCILPLRRMRDFEEFKTSSQGM